LGELQGLVDGVLAGGVLAAIAVGFTLAFGVLDIANFAHGDFVTVGMYVALLLSEHLGITPLLAAMVCLPIGLIVGAVLYLLGVNRVQRASRILQMVLTLGYLIIIENLLLYFFTSQERGVHVAAAQQVLRVGSIGFTVAQVENCGMGFALVLLTGLALRYTSFGTVIRACSQSDLGTRILHLPVRRAQAVALGWSLAMAMFAGALLMQSQPAAPSLGIQFTLEAFLVAVVGGLGSIGGAVVGALLYGALSGVLSALISPTIADIVTVAALIAVLAIAPTGVMGIRVRARTA
jgi:branched-chain amino acid transport system permease protein